MRGDIKEARLSGDEAYDRATWRHISSNIKVRIRSEEEEVKTRKQQ